MIWGSCQGSWAKKNKEERWWNPDKKLPETYELVTMLFENEKQQPGWWTGHNWDSGRKVDKDLKVVGWRRLHPVHETKAR